MPRYIQQNLMSFKGTSVARPLTGVGGRLVLWSHLVPPRFVISLLSLVIPCYYCRRMACNEETAVCFSWSHRQQNRRSLAADISDRGRRSGTKFCRLLEGGSRCTPLSRPVTFDSGVPPGSQNIEECKNFRNAFLQDGSTDLDEIWHGGGSFRGSRS